MRIPRPWNTKSLPPSSKLLEQARIKIGSAAVHGFFRGLSIVGRLHPRARPSRHGVEVLPDVPYRSTGLPEHTLDVYRPKERSGPLPVVLYVHGGGFRILSKDSHWLMGLAFARKGYVVFNINYRLAPRHPYPAAVEDSCAAYEWVAANARHWGGDSSRLILAGESAGANLVTTLAVAGSWQRPEPFVRAVFDSPMRPRGVIAACGILQVSEPERFIRGRRVSTIIADRLLEVKQAYLDEADPGGDGGLDLADPLCIIEKGAPQRPLPPFFAFAGTKDVLLDDTRRLAAALRRVDVPCDERYYEGEGHAFHALVWRPKAKECWRECYAFCERCIEKGAGEASIGSTG